MTALYKITNKKNNKKYIGVSNDPKRRFLEHCNKNKYYCSLIHRAIEKYGKDNFNFEILQWYDIREDALEAEKELIAKERTLAPYGYNIHPGGGDPPHYKGEKNSVSVITQETANIIIKQLLDWKIPRKTIIHNNHVTFDIVRHINCGDSWRQDSLVYPLRPTEKEIDKYRVLYIQWLCCSSNIPLNQIGKKVGWGRSSAKMINQGNNHYNKKLLYPIRNNKEYNKAILNQETCIDYLHFGE